MSDISKIQTNGETYDVKDATARETAESKVSSVNVGSVTTGDEPSVTNSGTDKDVVMDFVFPSGGQDARIVMGDSDGESVYLDGSAGIFALYDEYGTIIFSFMANGNSTSTAGSSRASMGVEDGRFCLFGYRYSEPFSYIAIIKD